MAPVCLDNIFCQGAIFLSFAHNRRAPEQKCTMLIADNVE
jgi:hypothetical protein